MKIRGVLLFKASCEKRFPQRHNSIFYAEIDDHGVCRGNTGCIAVAKRPCYGQTTIMVVCGYGCARHKIGYRKKWTCFVSHFDGHADQAVRCRAHCPVRQV